MGRNILRGEIVVKTFFNKLIAILFMQLFLFDLYAKVESCRLATDDSLKVAHIFTNSSIKGFMLEFTDHKVVKHFRDQYTTEKGKRYLEATMKRSVPYRQFIEEQLRKEELPRELLFLPVIESGYHSKAVSKAGAVGIWQFMRNSVGGYNILIDDWIDERQDPWKASIAALKKLKWNFKYYEDWCLALAAYNCGVGSLNKAIKKAGKKDYWYLADNGFLAKETRLYVPKFLAVSDILSNSEKHGIDWGESEGIAETDIIEIKQSIDLSLLADELGVSPSELSSLNPSLRFNITPPNVKYTLRVPAKQCEACKSLLSQKKLLLKYYKYKIRSGDNLSSLANHYGVSIKTILKYNSGIKNSNALRIGQEVIIPAIKKVEQYSPVQTSTSNTHAVPNLTARYVVKKGDSLWSIANIYNIRVEVLARGNGMSLNDGLSLGKVLRVPAKKIG